MITGEQVKKIRESLGEKQGPFGSRLGVDQATICRWEKNGIPDRTVTASRAVEKLLQLASEAPQ